MAEKGPIELYSATNKITDIQYIEAIAYRESIGGIVATAAHKSHYLLAISIMFWYHIKDTEVLII